MSELPKISRQHQELIRMEQDFVVAQLLSKDRYSRENRLQELFANLYKAQLLNWKKTLEYAEDFINRDALLTPDEDSEFIHYPNPDFVYSKYADVMDFFVLPKIEFSNNEEGYDKFRDYAAEQDDNGKFIDLELLRCIPNIGISFSFFARLDTKDKSLIDSDVILTDGSGNIVVQDDSMLTIVKNPTMITAIEHLSIYPSGTRSEEYIEAFKQLYYFYSSELTKSNALSELIDQLIKSEHQRTNIRIAEIPNQEIANISVIDETKLVFSDEYFKDED
jgi:hypothetical protein